MKNRIKVNFITGKVEAENCPVALQVFLTILVAAVFLALMYNFKGAIVIPMADTVLRSGVLKTWLKLPP